MVSLNDFLAKVQEIADEKPRYDLGGDGREGRCDCIGLIIGALRRNGYKWNGVHGSNWAARNAMAELNDIHTEGDLRFGWVVYKYRGLFDAGYDLPSRYEGHADSNDYYHVGVVISVSPLKIMHCTAWSGGNGIKIDTTVGKWRKAGPLKMVNMEEKEERIMPMGKMIVTAQSGTTVNLRSVKSTESDATIIERVKVGTLVEVLDTSGDWAKIQTPAGKAGYMKTAFLTTSGVYTTPVAPSPAVPDTVTLTINREAAAYLLEVLKGAM